MLAYKAYPTIFMLKSSSPCCSNNNSFKPKLHLNVTNKSLDNFINEPKFIKSCCSSVKNMKPRQLNMMHDMLCGRMVGDRPVFQQEFLIRSFDIGIDGNMSIFALASYLQETGLNHLGSLGMLGDGFSTIEMSKRDLVWVFSNMHIAVNHYPSWYDVIQVHTWMYESGRNALGVDWIISDLKTNDTLLTASSSCLMLNKTTRRLSRFIEEVREEMKPFFMPNCHPMIENRSKLQLVDDDAADFTHTGLNVGYYDLDANQHVNNVNYIKWFLEGTPLWIKENHQMCYISLEFRKECEMNETLKSLSRFDSHGNGEEGFFQLEHSIRLDGGPEVARGRTMWEPKHGNQAQ